MHLRLAGNTVAVISSYTQAVGCSLQSLHELRNAGIQRLEFRALKSKMKPEIL